MLEESGPGPPEVRRFRELLRQFPIVAVVSDERMMIRAVQRAADPSVLVHNFRWEMAHWEEFCEAVDLFWTDSVQAWLEAHPYAATGVHFRTLDARDTAPDLVLNVPFPDYSGCF